MVLHLLGKKSWNVYNQDNIERVRRDEAEAKSREEAAEQRMQEEDAQRRIALLRGDEVAPLPNTVDDTPKGDDWRTSKPDDTYARRDRKRRKLRGEDDVDCEMRYARQDLEAARGQTKSLISTKEKDAPLEDHAGNIQLFPAPDEKMIRKAQKNEELEAEKAKKKKRKEDQVTMRFSNAAGYQNGMQKPWYATPAATSARDETPLKEVVLAEVQGRDVWGNEDPRRREREQNRISSNDPFAAMQQAQHQLKKSARDREAWERKQRAELEAMKRDQRRTRKASDDDELDGFSLDASTEKEISGDRERSRRHHHHDRSRQRSRSRQHGEKRHRHRSHSRERKEGRHRGERHHDRGRD